jgi:hypothetical protein
MVHGDTCKNKHRAERALKGLDYHATLIDPFEKDYERKVLDLLIDIMHFCEQQNLKFHEIFEDSTGNYICEQNHENEQCTNDD